MTPIRSALLSAALLLPSTGMAASLTTITFGDEDCFGTNAANCAAGTEMTAPMAGFDANGILPFPTLDNSTALDHPGTDIFGELGPLSFDFNVDLNGQVISAATLDVKVWGLDLSAVSTANGGQFGDAFEGARFQMNGTDIGTYFAPAGPGPNLIDIASFAIDPNLINNGGSNTISIIPEQDFLQFASNFFTGNDAFAVDFVRVSLTSDTAAPVVPLPAGLPLLLGGLAVLGIAKRRRG